MLSQVELNERLRSMKISQRLVYSLLLAVLLVTGFVLTTALGIAVMIALVTLLVGGALVIPDDIVVLGFPVLAAFLLTTGLVGLSSHEGITPGQTISRAARAGLRGGLVRGFLVGAGCGFLWALFIQGNALLYMLLLGVSISLAFSLFEALSSIAEPICLRVVANPNPSRIA